jgi:hypothetical protein
VALSEKAILSMTLMVIIPKKKITKANLFRCDILLYLKSKYPTVMLNKPHIILTIGAESPCPGGSANGVGKGLPEIPFTKWGTAFARNIPAKNAAT